MGRHEGGSALSSREREIVLLAARGLTDKEIKRRLGVSTSTVATYWKRIRDKLDTVNRAEAIAKLLTTQLTTQTRHVPDTSGMLTVGPADPVVTWAPGKWAAFAVQPAGSERLVEPKPAERLPFLDGKADKRFLTLQRSNGFLVGQLGLSP